VSLGTEHSNPEFRLFELVPAQEAIERRPNSTPKRDLSVDSDPELVPTRVDRAGRRQRSSLRSGLGKSRFSVSKLVLE
jgi:hypothetical protein